MAPLLTIKFGGTHLWYSKIRGVHVSVEHSKLILWCDVEFIEFFFFYFTKIMSIISLVFNFYYADLNYHLVVYEEA